MTTSLIQFNSTANAIVTTNDKSKSTSVRLLTAKEFKESRGLRGQEAKRAYNAYLKEQGKANTAGLAAALTSGELLVKGFSDYRSSLRVSFAKASSLKDPCSKAVQKVAHTIQPSREEAIRALGLTEEQVAFALKSV